MARPRDQGTTVIEKIVCYTHRSLKEGGTLCLGGKGTHGEASGLVRRWRE